MTESTGYTDIDGKEIFDGDNLASIVSKTRVEVLFYHDEWCIRNKIGEIIPFKNLQHSLIHSDRLLLREIIRNN